MPTSTAQLVDATASVVQDGLRCRGMQRALQLAEMLPKHPRVHDATEVEGIHAAVWALAILWTGRQSHAPTGVAKIYHLPPKDHAGWRHPALQPDDRMVRRTDPGERAASFGEAVFAMIDRAAGSPEGRAWVCATFRALELLDDGQAALIHHRDGSVETYQSPRVHLRTSPDGLGPLVETSTRIRVEFVIGLADQVAITRAEAKRRGIAVDTGRAFRALGAEPLPPRPAQDSEPASGSAGVETTDPENTAAEGAGTPPAVLCLGQPAERRGARLPAPHPKEGREETQDPPDLRAGRSTESKDRRHGENSTPPLAA